MLALFGLLIGSLLGVMWERWVHKSVDTKYRNALQEIKNKEGKVCDTFELCTHRACQSSYSSWAIADKALK